MNDIEIFSLTYSKAEIDTAILAEETRALTAEALKLDESEVGGDNGVLRLSGGFVSAADTDYASNAEALAGTAIDKVMSPLRVAEFQANVLALNTGLLGVSTSVTQNNTFNIAASKATFYDTTDVDTNDHLDTDATNQEIDVNTTGIYRIFGNMSLEAGSGDVIYLQPYINGSPTGQIMSTTGRGSGKPVSISYNAIASLTAADVFSIYGSSDADSTAVAITSCFVGLEKTVHG